MRILITLAFFAFVLNGRAQNAVDTNAAFAKQVVQGLPAAGYYFIGQLHNNAANTILEKELLFALHNRFGKTYDIIEYGHSLAFMFNEYLRTGEDSILSYTLPSANFHFVKAVRAFNDTVPEDRRIRFYGLDFENRIHGRLTKKALSVIRDRLQDKNNSLYHLLDACVRSDSSALRKNLTQLKTYLAKNNAESKTVLKDHYLDVALMANAQYDFSPKRDFSMYRNFKLLCDELSGPPVFFSSFGIGHITPDNRNGLAHILNTAGDSPLKDRVSTIGIQYLNCHFESSDKFEKTTGSMSFLCHRSQLEQLTPVGNGQPLLRYIPSTSFTSCSEQIKKFAGIIVAEHFPSSKYWISE